MTDVEIVIPQFGHYVFLTLTVGALPGGLDIMSLVVDYGYLQDTNTSLLSLSLIFCEPDLLYTMPLETVSTIPQSFQFLFNKLKL